MLKGKWAEGAAGFASAGGTMVTPLETPPSVAVEVHLVDDIGNTDASADAAGEIAGGGFDCE